MTLQDLYFTVNQKYKNIYNNIQKYINIFFPRMAPIIQF